MISKIMDLLDKDPDPDILKLLGYPIRSRPSLGNIYIWVFCQFLFGIFTRDMDGGVFNYYQTYYKEVFDVWLDQGLSLSTELLSSSFNIICFCSWINFCCFIISLKKRVVLFQKDTNLSAACLREVDGRRRRRRRRCALQPSNCWRSLPRFQGPSSCHPPSSHHWSFFLSSCLFFFFKLWILSYGFSILLFLRLFGA